MNRIYQFLIFFCFFVQNADVFSQQPRFNLVAPNENYNWGTIADIKQDPQGYLWLSTQLKGLQRYDGSNFVSYVNDPGNPNSLSNDRVPCIHIDSSGIVWAATYGGGLDKFDPANNSFIHFRHNPKDAGSLANDTVFAILRDHLGILWIGTYGGLDMLDEKTGNFIHFKNVPGDLSSLSYNRVWYLYEDMKGELWVGCGSPFFNLGESHEDGGLNRFDRVRKKFTRYLHDPNDSNSIANNKVRTIFEDSKGNFWVGSAGDGLHTLDRKSGKFTHFYYDPAHPEKLSRPQTKKLPIGLDHITFINEDHKGLIWIGSLLNGINKYDPVEKKITHFGYELQDNKIISVKDTTMGFHDFSSWRFFRSKDSLLWISATMGNLYNVDLSEKTTIPYYPINQPEANSFYYEPQKNCLWIGTLKGLVCRNLTNQTERSWTHNPINKNSLCNDSIISIKADVKGNLWIATFNGLCKFDLNREVFITYQHSDTNPKSISGNSLTSLFIDRNNNVWVSPGGWIVDKLNPETGVFTHYRYSNDSNLQNSSPQAYCIREDINGDIWIATAGVIRLDPKSGKIYRYLPNTGVPSVCIDAAKTVWAGGEGRLFRYDRKRDEFLPFLDPNTQSDIQGILHILEDKHQNLWIATKQAIVKINARRDELRVYGNSYGVHKNTFFVADNFAANNGKLFFGDENGYYSFSPEMVEGNETGPLITFTSFKINGHEISTSTDNNMLKEPLWRAKLIKLKYDQNTFSLDFVGIDFRNPGEKKYFFKLEGFEHNWHYLGADHSAYLFNVPPGSYTFLLKAVSMSGTSTEKSIKIIIAPPWWRTWWAYVLYGLLFLSAAYLLYRFQRNRLIQQERQRASVKELAQAKEIEKAYHELKNTQAQLVQREKMASLGELTAGIAHEIQNPLNFVNNFSEVNRELIEELRGEKLKSKGERNEVFEEQILNDIGQNLEKINQHGKRADSIVKGMLQHSRISSGQKELTDINALADEYLRLSYHGMRGKEKTFHAVLQTDLEKHAGRISVIPQDIGRVFLNLYNNAFYSMMEKAKLSSTAYQPTISVATSRHDGKINITVKDNGMGISEKIKEKIFQPFFTTRPAGSGTGLGLSLSYDIITKEHGGEIRVNSKEGEGAEFMIILPL